MPYKDPKVHNAAARRRYALDPAKKLRKNRAYFEANKPRFFEWRFLHRYGISSEKYMELHAAQEGKCKICQKPETIVRLGILQRLSVDHDHKTGLVRGLLCILCNRKLGVLDKDPDWTTKAIAYLNPEIL